MTNSGNEQESQYEEKLPPNVKIWERDDWHKGMEYVEIPIRQRNSGRIIRKLLYWGSGHTGEEVSSDT